GVLGEVSLWHMREALVGYVDSTQLTPPHELTHSFGVALRQPRGTPPSERGTRPPDEGEEPDETVRLINLKQVTNEMGHLDAHLSELHTRLLIRYQVFLDSLMFKTCPTCDENCELATRVSNEAGAFGIRLYFGDPIEDKYHPVTVR